MDTRSAHACEGRRDCRLRKLKQALEAKTSRLPPAELLRVPHDDGEEFQRSVPELQRVGVEISRLASKSDMNQGDDDVVSGQQLLTGIDLLLDRMEATPRDPLTPES